MSDSDTRPPSDESGAQPVHRGWYERGYLPHFDSPERIQFLTWRLADSCPAPLRDRLEEELQSLLLSDSEMETERMRRIERILDRGYGNCWLRRKACAEIVRSSLQAEEGIRYQLHAWVIMPNHVHVLVQFLDGHAMGEVIDSWKGSMSHEINKVLRRSGSVWQEDFWDRYIRDEEHYQNARRYIIMNPVRAGLVSNPNRWSWWWALGC